MRLRCLLVSLIMAPLVAGALELETLSPEARALFPEGREGIVEPKAGAPVRGLVISDTPESVTLKIKRTETISMSRTFRRAEINSFKYLDVQPQFAVLLLDMKTDDKSSLKKEEYERAVGLFDEFLAKCPAAPELKSIEERRAVFADELQRLKKGWEKVGGEWLTPIRAAVKKFDLYTDDIAEIRKRPDFKGNQKAQAAADEAVEKRRTTARDLPGLMQQRIPELIDRRLFDEAVEEMSAFLGFWLKQVVRSEGAPDFVVGEMNFDYILKMQDRIMAAYRDAGMGSGRKGPKAPGMVYIPGGYFLMGNRDAKPSDDAFPHRIVHVAPYLIDMHEVSNAEYRRFVEHVNSTGDSSMEHPDCPPLKKHDAEGWKKPELSGDSQPVVGIDWFDAYAYAKWAGKELPTEAQWEKAARGLDARSFPWGEDPVNRCAISCAVGRNFIGKEMDRQKPPPPPPPPPRFGCGWIKKDEPPPPPPPPTVIPAVTFDVDKSLPQMALLARQKEMFEWNKEYPSPYGPLHMSGNAAEWVLDWYGDKYYGDAPLRDPAGPGKTSGHVYRGGSYLSGGDGDLKTWARAVGRGREASGCDGRGQPFIGFRCVKNLDNTAGGQTEAEK